MAGGSRLARRLFDLQRGDQSNVNRPQEKHFLVIAVVEPVPPEAPVVDIDLQAVHAGRVQRIAWRTLTDAAVWKRGWV